MSVEYPLASAPDANPVVRRVADWRSWFGAAGHRPRLVQTIMLLAAAALFLTPAPSLAQGPTPAQSPVLVRRSVQFDMHSKVSGRTYRIFVFKPAAPPPPAGYPVLVVTDANMTFPLAATVDATFGLGGGKSALIVGVGYAADDDFTPIMLRNRDLTPPTPLSGIEHNPGMPAPKPEDFGVSEEFYRFLTEELRPVIAASYPVDASDQTLYGHSLAGLFTLGVLFNHPQSFRNFVASSPSIWWNNRAILNDEPGFAQKVRSGAASPRVLILVGGKEQDAPDALLPGMTREQLAKVVLQSRMVDNAAELAAQLQQIKGGPGYLVRFHAFDGDDHLTALPASIGRALAFALRP
jgi:predicted alpha/beta superfamily hydrolase